MNKKNKKKSCKKFEEKKTKKKENIRKHIGKEKIL
jgi:hypothetical protein